MSNTILRQLVKQGWVTHRSHCRAIDLHDNRQWGNPENRDAECDCGLSTLLAAEGETRPAADDDALVERLAAWDHDAWSRWMRHLWSKCKSTGTTDAAKSGLYMPVEWRHRWERQIDTPYTELTEAEKESDRREARDILAVIRAATPPPASRQERTDAEMAVQSSGVSNGSGVHHDAIGASKVAPSGPQDGHVALIISQAQDWCGRVFDSEVSGAALTPLERQADEIIKLLLICVETEPATTLPVPAEPQEQDNGDRAEACQGARHWTDQGSLVCRCGALRFVTEKAAERPPAPQDIKLLLEQLEQLERTLRNSATSNWHARTSQIAFGIYADELQRIASLPSTRGEGA